MQKLNCCSLVSCAFFLILNSIVPSVSAQYITNKSARSQNEQWFGLEKQVHKGHDEYTYKTGWKDVGIILAGGLITYVGLQEQAEHKQLSENEVFSLKKSDVNWFDRGAINQNVARISISRRRSDAILNLSMGMVSLLALDKKVRHEWKNGLALYIETIAVTTTLQTWTANKTNRIRPIAYMGDADTGKRLDKRNKNSFYSGHTASASTVSFFAAKFYSDLHPELGNKKWLLYAAALIPPALVGRYRVKGGKHFYSDVLIGAAMGAASGILVPEWHKRSRSKRITITPQFGGNSLGMNLRLSI